MVTKRNDVQKGLSARKNKEILDLLEDHYAIEMVRMLDTARHFSGSDFRRFRTLINDEFITPYHAKKYGLADFLKKAIENWLHARHANGEIPLSFIDHRTWLLLSVPPLLNMIFSGAVLIAFAT